MSRLGLNIHAWEQGQVLKVTKFIVAFFLKYNLVYFTKKQNSWSSPNKNTNNVNSTPEQNTVWKLIKTFSAINRFVKMQIFDEWHHYDSIIPEYENSL